MNLYVKTDGPVPKCAEFILGKLYLVEYITLMTFTVFDEDGLGFTICKQKPCEASTCNIPWTFCDSAGNPVAAPWESVTGIDLASGPDEVVYASRIDYRAHAESLAEALDGAEKWAAYHGMDPSRSQFGDWLTSARAALSTYNKAKD